jgi:hypothetical protein
MSSKGGISLEEIKNESVDLVFPFLLFICMCVRLLRKRWKM